MEGRRYAEEDGQIDPAQLLKAVYDSGVTVAEMDVTAREKYEGRLGNLALQVSPNHSFLSHRMTYLEMLNRFPIHLRHHPSGELYRKPQERKSSGFEPLKLLILEVQKKE